MVRQWVLVPPFGGSNPSSPARNVKNDPKGRFLDSSLEESGIRAPRRVRIPHEVWDSTSLIPSQECKNDPKGRFFDSDIVFSPSML